MIESQCNLTKQYSHGGRDAIYRVPTPIHGQFSYQSACEACPSVGATLMVARVPFTPETPAPTRPKPLPTHHHKQPPHPSDAINQVPTVELPSSESY